MSFDLDTIACKAYNEFRAKNEELFKNCPQEYWMKARQYKEQKVREYKLEKEGKKQHGGETNGNYRR